MPEIKLNAKDKKILSILDMNARLPLSQIAKKVGLSREVVHYRIKQLEKKGVVEGYYAVLDTSKLNLIYCRILLKYREMTQQKEKELLKFCKLSKHITWVSLNQGKWDITIVVLAKDLETIEKAYDELNLKFGKYFQNPYISIAFKIYHYKHNYLYQTKDTQQVILGEKKQVKLDKTDHAILHILAENARASLLDIAQKLKTTPKLISYRINRLVKEEVILAFRAKMNTKLLGYDHYKLFLNLQHFTKADYNKVLTYLQHHPHVIYVTKPMGQHNLEFEAMFKGSNQLHEFMREFSFQFADIFISYEYLACYTEPQVEYYVTE